MRHLSPPKTRRQPGPAPTRRRRHSSEATTSPWIWLAHLHQRGIETLRDGGDAGRLVRGLLEAVTDVAPCACVSVWLADSQSLELSTDTDVHGAASPIARAARTVGPAVAEVILAAGRVRGAAQPATVAYPAEIQDTLSACGVRALHAVPMRSRDADALGVLILWFGDSQPGVRPRSPLIDLLVRQVSDFLEWHREAARVTAQVVHAERRAEGAAAALRRRDEFMAVLSHKLRQPLAAALPALEVQHRSGDADHRQRATVVIEQQLRQLTRLIDDLSDLSHMHRGSLVLRRQRVDLREVLNEALETTAAAAGVKQHRRTVDLGLRPAWAVVDVGRMAQVFSNLLRNAAAYTPDGGRIDLTLHMDEAQLQLHVRDSGIGIPPADLERIFTPFERAASRHSRGLGVGLAIVRQIVEMHGGTVSASSEGTDRGSEFVVSLPIGGAASAG